jgi:hypothetical protein
VFPATLPTPRTQAEILATITSALAAAINEDLGAGFTALADGGNLIIASRVDRSFTAQGFGTPKLVPAARCRWWASRAPPANRCIRSRCPWPARPVKDAVWLLNLVLGGTTYTFEYQIGRATPWATS